MADPEESSIDPELQQFLTDFIKPSTGHRDKDGNLVVDDPIQEINNKLSVLHMSGDMPQNYGGDNHDAWMVAGIKKVIEVYPNEKDYIKKLIGPEPTPEERSEAAMKQDKAEKDRSQRRFKHLQQYYNAVFPEKED